MKRILLAAAVIGLLFQTAGAKAFDKKESQPAFDVEVVSSAPDQVTGGDARIHIQVPKNVSLDRVQVLVNGVDQSAHFSPLQGERTITGVIDGLVIGDNHLSVRFAGKGKAKHLTLTNYPVTGPVFSGPHQYPFICTTGTQGLGQPLVDNDTEGFRVTDGNGSLTGYSIDCSAETKVEYVYKPNDGGDFKPYVLGGERPADIAQTTTIDGKTVDYIVRWERGTINRFIYSIAMLAPNDKTSQDLDRSAWNGKLIYYFQGGVAIGHSQGKTSRERMLYDTGLSRGYAVVYSTGTKTGTHYNLVLGGETALMVKERFVELYDSPIYTTSVGGSGGGIQQYIYAQNHPGLLDGIIPQYAYPDMVTQTAHVGDCELLENYMDNIDTANDLWGTWSNRTILEGLNASDTFINSYTGKPGSTECIEGWRGLSPLVLNPLYGAAEGQGNFVPQDAVATIEWTHFGDLVNFYGVDPYDGYAKRTWDNVGVQYGLEAVASGQITPAEFMRLNGTIGGWKEELDMVQEGSPFFPPGVIDFTNWDPWSARNQIYSLDPLENPAPRTQGDVQAMQAAYESGLVFMGKVDIPVIDWRNYLERELNMHNTHQSFASRQRIRDARGNSDNQVIWFTDGNDAGGEFDQTPEALTVMDDWLMNIIEHPEKGVAGNKPPEAVDTCFDSEGYEIASGDHVWDGILDDLPPGECTQEFPTYTTSRIVAGGPFRGSIFKCQLESVSQAVADGEYGQWQPSAEEQVQLEKIFPDGVCDFSKPDDGLPPGWQTKLNKWSHGAAKRID